MRKNGVLGILECCQMILNSSYLIGFTYYKHSTITGKCIVKIQLLPVKRWLSDIDTTNIVLRVNKLKMVSLDQRWVTTLG